MSNTTKSEENNISTKKEKTVQIGIVEPEKSAVKRKISRPLLQRLASTAPIRYRDLFTSWRFGISLLLMYSLVIGNLPKMTITMSVICMVRPNQPSDNNSSVQPVTNATDHDKPQPRDNYEFDWGPDIIGLILASTSFTQFISPILGDLVRRCIGNKLTLCIFYSLSAGLLFISPTAARSGYEFLILVCALQGCVMQANFVVLGDTLAWWSPPNEKLLLTAIIYSGVSLAGLVGNVMAGLLCTIPIDNGWPFIFYSFGVITTVWVVLWAVFSSRIPEDHPFISEKETRFIISQRPNMDNASSTKIDRPPYKSIFKSVPFWSYLICGWSFYWFLTGMLTYLPIFFEKAQGFETTYVGILIGMFSITGLAGNLFWASLGRKLRERFDKNKCRKMCTFLGLTSAGVLVLVLACILQVSNRWINYALIQLVVFSLSSGSSTLTVISLDMAPRYAGFINAIWMSSSTLVSTSSPIVISKITQDNSLEQWQTTFFIFAAVIISGTVVFTVFGEANIQPWADGNPAAKPTDAEGAVVSSTANNADTELERKPDDSKETLGDPMDGLGGIVNASFDLDELDGYCSEVSESSIGDVTFNRNWFYITKI